MHGLPATDVSADVSSVDSQLNSRAPRPMACGPDYVGSGRISHGHDDATTVADSVLINTIDAGFRRTVTRPRRRVSLVLSFELAINEKLNVLRLSAAAALIMITSASCPTRRVWPVNRTGPNDARASLYYAAYAARARFNLSLISGGPQSPSYGFTELHGHWWLSDPWSSSLGG